MAIKCHICIPVLGSTQEIVPMFFFLSFMSKFLFKSGSGFFPGYFIVVWVVWVPGVHMPYSLGIGLFLVKGILDIIMWFRVIRIWMEKFNEAGSKG